MRYYEHWGPEHVKVLLIIAAVMAAVLTPVALKADKKKTVTVLRILAVSHLVLEVIQDILLVKEEYDIMWMLPLHLCNLGIFVNLTAAFAGEKIRKIFAEISVMLIMPGALGALLFPDWNYRPIDDPVAIVIFTTHTVLLLIPLIMIIKGISDIRISHIFYPLIFMAAVVPPIYLFDKKFEVNYLFLRFPVASSPLSFIHDKVGEHYYVLGMFFLLITVLLAEYLIAYILRKIIPSKRR